MSLEQEDQVSYLKLILDLDSSIEKYLAAAAQMTSPNYGLQRLKFILGDFPFVNLALVFITLLFPNNLLVLIAFHYLMFVEDGYVGEVRMTMMLA